MARSLGYAFVALLTGCACGSPSSSDGGITQCTPANNFCVDAGRADAGAADAGCTPETDAAFCTSQGKTCDSFTGVDNCGQTRTANCGTCSGSTPACVGNVCVAPQCSNSFSATGTALPTVNVAGKQSALLGASSDGTSLLYLQATFSCVGSGANLIIADESVPGSGVYTNQDITANANLASFSKGEETMTLGGLGLEIIGVITGGNGWRTSSRSAVGQTDFSAPTEGGFATLNTTVPTGGTLSWPVLSSDRLAFYFRVNGATNSAQNGIYESVRSAATDQFPAATLMPSLVQTYGAVSGMSTDRLTAFMATNSFGTAILTRDSLSQPFSTPATSSPPGQAFRIIPISNCATLVGTCEPGGCAAETICEWAAQ